MTPTDLLAILGALTGVTALVISALHLIFRDRPLLKIFEVYTRPEEGGLVRVPRSKEAAAGEKKGELTVHLHMLLTNTGLRPARIIKAELLLRGKKRSQLLTETRRQVTAGGIIANLTGLLKDNELRGTRLGPGDFVDDVVDFSGPVDLDFPFSGLKADLRLEFSHTRRKQVVGNIPVRELKTADPNGKLVLLDSALDANGQIRKDFLNPPPVN